MVPVGVLAAFSLLPMILGSAPECDDEELAFPDGKDVKNAVVTEIPGKMSSKPLYDCDLQKEAQEKFDFLDEDGDEIKYFKFVNSKDMSRSKQEFVKQAVENWSQKLATMSSTKFGCTCTQRDYEGTPTERLLGCVFN